MATGTPAVQIDLESLLSRACRARDLLTGARAWLAGIAQLGAASACNSVLEARGELDGVIHALESLAAVEAEAARAEHAHRMEQARVSASQVGVSR